MTRRTGKVAPGFANAEGRLLAAVVVANLLGELSPRNANVVLRVLYELVEARERQRLDRRALTRDDALAHLDKVLDVTPRNIRAALATLEGLGAVAFDAAGLTLTAGVPAGLDTPEIRGRLARLPADRPTLRIPRARLRELARCEKLEPRAKFQASKVALELAALFWEADGRMEVSRVAEAFGLDPRTVRQAWKACVADGSLVAEAMQGKGTIAFRIDREWGRSPTPKNPEVAPKNPAPHKERTRVENPPTEVRTTRPEPRGDGTGRFPDPKSRTQADSPRDMEFPATLAASLDLLGRFVAQGKLRDCEADRVSFLAELLRIVRSKEVGNPVGMLIASVPKDFPFVKWSHEQLARRWLAGKISDACALRSAARPTIKPPPSVVLPTARPRPQSLVPTDGEKVAKFVAAWGPDWQRFCRLHRDQGWTEERFNDHLPVAQAVA